jgi:hypothetical protein
MNKKMESETEKTDPSKTTAPEERKRKPKIEELN